MNVQNDAATDSPAELSKIMSKGSRAVRELQSRLSNLGGSRSTVGKQLRDIGSKLRVLVPKISWLKSASQLYSEMETLEMKIITEALPFSREQELMKVIKEKRKLLVGQFGTVKHEYVVAEASLQEKLHEISDVKRKLDTVTAARKKAEVKQKEAQLTEKLRSGKKLTARDLMMLRGVIFKKIGFDSTHFVGAL